MSLLDDQKQFALMVAALILKAEAMGYEMTLGDAYRDERCGYGHPNSLHRSRLAIDLNLFNAAGEYITDDEGHRELHLWWESIGGSPMIEGDPNHYSKARGGMI